MTNNYRPITPPPELFKQWEDDILNERDNVDHVLDCAWGNGFQVGADQELEACCEWIYKLMDRGLEWSMDLHAARRPKPPSLKEQSIALIDKIQGNKEMWDIRDLDVIRQALESLPD